MKNKKIERCPGCGKHCPLSAPRCKYGRNYAAKINGQKDEACPFKAECKHKGEKYVVYEQPLWQMLTISRRIKKGLCHARFTEAELMAALTPQQQMQFGDILCRLQAAVERKNQEKCRAD